MVERFDFNAEAAEIQPDSVKSLSLDVIEPAMHARVTLVTLEEQTYELDWTV